jgi:hypothetical protein
MKDILKSIAVGLSATFGLLFLVLITDPSSESSLLDRHPFAWSFFWPAALIPKENVLVWLITSLVANVALYSVLTYIIIRRRKMGERLA